MTDTSDSADCFEVGPDGQLRRKDGKDHPKLLGDAFRRDEHGEIRFDGTSTPRRSVLQNSKTLVASGLVLDGESPSNVFAEAEKHMSSELREQSARTPIWDSDLQRKAIGLPVSTSTAASPKDEPPINPLFPSKRGDGIADESPGAKARREQRTPHWDNDTASNGGSPATPKDLAGDARAKASALARTPTWDASGQDAKRPA